MSGTLGPARCRRAVLALVALALVVRVGAVIATPGYAPMHDDRDYDRLACWVAEHGLPPDRSPPRPGPASCATRGRSGSPTAYRPPLWPMVLGGTYAAAEAVGVPRRTAGRLVQAAIGTVMVVLAGALAAELWGGAVGLAALGLGAIFLPLVLDGMTLISEPLFVALELAAVLAVMRHRRSPAAMRWALAAGALVGLAALARTTGALLAVPLVAAIAAQRPRPGALAAGAAFAAVAVLVVAPWTVRNAVVLGAFVPVSTEVGPTLLGTYNASARDAPGCTGCWILLSDFPAQAGLVRRLRPLGEVARDRLDRRLAGDFVRGDPGYVLTVAWHNSLRLLELEGADRTRFTASTIDVPPGAAVAGAWELWLVLAAAAVAVVRGALRRVPAWLLALPVLLWIATVVVQSETPRFRAPLDPLLVALAAAAIRPWCAPAPRSRR